MISYPAAITRKERRPRIFHENRRCPFKDGFPFTGNNNVMTKFINHRAILQKSSVATNSVVARSPRSSVAFLTLSFLSFWPTVPE
jgi:hypothetical protein